MGSGEEVLDDLDTTLDELIVNAHTLRQIQRNDRFTAEAKALEKTQESLLARVLYRQKILDAKWKKEISERAAQKEMLIEAKIKHFAKINTTLANPTPKNLIPKKLKRHPFRLSRHRKRALLHKGP